MTTNDFKTRIATAAWNWNIWQFCEALGFDPEKDYAKDKYLKFQELAEALNAFDARTLDKIIEAGAPLVKPEPQSKGSIDGIEL